MARRPLSSLPLLDVLRLGRMPYAEAHALQQTLVEERIADARPDTLVLCEHDAVITVGRKHAEARVFPPGIAVIEVERGGDATFHGTGQIVAYPIFKLEPERRDLHRFLRDLEQVVIDVLSEVSVPGVRKEASTGVWVGAQKVCSIGVAVRRWVTWHGLALNLSVDLDVFRGFRPCGLDGDVMANLADFTEVPPHRLLYEVLLVKHFCLRFGHRLPDPSPPRPTSTPGELPIFPGP